MLRYLSAILVAVTVASGSALADDVRSGSFVFSAWSGPPVTVFFVEPAPDVMEDAPVVIVLHGVDRNADDYARNWESLARQFGLRIYAPEFSAQSFPGAALYNLGGVGTDGPHAFAAIEPLFSAISGRGGQATGYYLFGHSAGAQVVHRALLFEEMPRLHEAYAANAGWYTMPDTRSPWPYGLHGTPADEDSVRRWVGLPLVVMLGDRDTDPDDPNLRRSTEAAAQGEHRYARGMHFVAAAEAAAVTLGAAFSWRVVRVPGIAHDNAGMAQTAAVLIAAEALRAAGQAE